MAGKTTSKVKKNANISESSPSATPQFIMFPKANSEIIPKPSQFFSSNLLSSPLPTTSFFTNFVIGNGDQPAFVHPYLIKLSYSSLSVCYPSISSSSASVFQDFLPDFTISTSQASSHLVSSFSDLTVTVDFLSSDFQFLLAKGSPYITLQVSRNLPLAFTTNSEIESFSSSKYRHKIQLKNKQTWIIYASSELSLIIKVNDRRFESSKSFSGVVRIAVIPNDNCAKSEEVLDLYSTCYAISGEATISAPSSMEYKWEIKGWGDELLMLAHPLHLNLLSVYNSGIKVLDDFKYKSIDGTLVGVIGKKWKLRVDIVPISWHSRRRISKENHPDIVKALQKDVEALDSTNIMMTTTDVYHYAMQICKAATLALIAEEVNCKDKLDPIKEYLRKNIGLWLSESDNKRGFLYEEKWGGVITNMNNADHGFGLYNNHLSTLGHFVFSIAVLAKIDKEWGENFKGQAYALVGSYMSMSMKKSKYTKLRCFDVYKLHSWTKHLGDDKQPRNCENPCASIHAYYAASLLGRVYEDEHLVTVGSTLASFEIEAAKTWWHVKEGGVYEGAFLKENKIVGMILECKREATLWFTTPENKERRVGIQLNPLMPELSETLFSDVGFVKDVVHWVKHGLTTQNATDDWKGLVYALEAMYDNENALPKIKDLTSFVQDNSSSNMLWWTHCRVGRNNCCIWSRQEPKNCGYCAHCC